MKRIYIALIILVVLICLWAYIDYKEDDCLSAGICPNGYKFEACDWDGCVVDENSCQGRGQWDQDKQKCFFKN